VRSTLHRVLNRAAASSSASTEIAIHPPGIFFRTNGRIFSVTPRPFFVHLEFRKFPQLIGEAIAIVEESKRFSIAKLMN
jgi:hypothetical protein